MGRRAWRERRAHRGGERATPPFSTPGTLGPAAARLAPALPCRQHRCARAGHERRAQARARECERERERACNPIDTRNAPRFPSLSLLLSLSLSPVARRCGRAGASPSAGGREQERRRGREGRRRAAGAGGGGQRAGKRGGEEGAGGEREPVLEESEEGASDLDGCRPSRGIGQWLPSWRGSRASRGG